MLLSIATLIWLGMKLCRSRFATATRDGPAQTEQALRGMKEKMPDKMYVTAQMPDKMYATARMPDKMYVTAYSECVHCDANCRALNGSRTVKEKRRCSCCCPA